MTTSRRVSILVALVALAVGLSACRSPLGGELGDGETGSIRILLPSSGGAVGAKGVLQDLVGTVASWRVTGEGPGSATCDIPVMASGGTITVELLVGEWELTLTGLDADGSAVMSSTMAVKVEKTDTPKPTAFTMAWSDKALVARLSFDEAIEDDKGRVTVTPGGSGLSRYPSSASDPSMDGKSYLVIPGSGFLDITRNDGTAIDLGSELSVSLWVYPNSLGDSVLITSKQSGGGFGFSISLDGAGCVKLTTADNQSIVTAEGITNTDWTLVTVAINSTTGQSAILINGSLVQSGVVGTFGPPVSLRVGCALDGASSFYSGRIDDVRIVAGTIDASYIGKLYFSGGLGSSAAPYIVSTPMDLYNIRCFPAAQYLQTADIDLSANDGTKVWTPVPSFTGTYDGGGKTISNIDLGTNTEPNTGFFRMISTGGVVRNLTMDTVAGSSSANSTGALAGSLTGATVSGVALRHVDISQTTDFVGGLAGTCNASTIQDITMTDVTVANTGFRTGGLVATISNGDASTLSRVAITGLQLSGTQYVGGLAGSMIAGNLSTISDSTVSGSITFTSANSQYIGGFCGQAYGTMTNCAADVTIAPAQGLSGYTAMQVGGFAGSISSTSAASTQLDGCRASGGVTGRNASSGSQAFVGGFAGRIAGSGATDVVTLDSCSATGDVSSDSGTSVGGFVGVSGCLSNFTSCDATGTVQSGGSDVGGFAGYAAGSGVMLRCYALGAVTGTTSVGGFAGSQGDTASMSQCFASGSVSGTYNVGGFIGTMSAGSIADSYARGSVSATLATNVAGFVGIINYTGTSLSTSYSATPSILNGTGAFAGATTDNQVKALSGCYWDTSASSDVGSLINPLFSGTGTSGITDSSGVSLTGGTNPGAWDTTTVWWPFSAGSLPSLAWEHQQ